MAYNNFYGANQNPYAQYPYTAYGNNNMQQQYNQPIYQQPQQMQQQTTQQQYFPLTKVNGIEGAKAFIVQPNQIYYLLDVEDMILFEKKLDNQGNPILEPFELVHRNIADIGKKPAEEPKIDLSAYVSKKDLSAYATVDDISRLDLKLDNALDKISRQIETLNSRGGRNFTPQNPQTPKKENE